MSDVRLNAAILKFLRNSGRAVTVGDLLEHTRSLGLLASHAMPAVGPIGAAPADLALSYQGLSSAPLGLDLLLEPFVRRLETLHGIGLIVLQPAGWGFRSAERQYERRVEIAPKFVEMQIAIGFSLTEAATRKPNTMSVAPVFGFPDRHDVDVFAIMPFAKEFDGVYRTIAQCCQELSLKARRADDLFKPAHVIHDIWSLTASARLVVCDCTSKNPNVFYELGIAHTLGKGVVLITSNEADIPFDLRHWRYLVYDPHKPETLQAGLREYLKQAVASN